jgi:GNAT superfamily N-acetyltransferase
MVPSTGTSPLRHSSLSVRPFNASDVGQVAALHELVFPDESGLRTSELERYFSDVFLNNPWMDDALPSLVCEYEGKVVGFVGVLPRVMWAGNRKIRVAVHSQSMVDPKHRVRGVAIELLKAAMAGEQELSLTDGASENSRRLWEVIGGVAPLIYNLHWLRLFRPGAFVLSRISMRSLLAPLDRVASAFLWPVDSLTCRLYGVLKVPRCDADEPIAPEELVECIRTFASSYTLRPDYDAQGMRWLLTMAAQKDHPTTLRTRCVRDSGRQITGWYAYYLEPGGVSQVLQIGGARQHIGSVIDHLFYDAVRHGSLAIAGRMEPNFARELSARGVVYVQRGANFLCRSRNRELLQAIAAGDAFLSRLEGEWWMRFHERAGQSNRFKTLEKSGGR